MYRGMHHLTDVIFGALLGTASVVLVTVILCRAEDRRRAHAVDRARSGPRAADDDARPAPLDAAPGDELAPPIVVPTGTAP
jgi:hypothetical protein